MSERGEITENFWFLTLTTILRVCCDTLLSLFCNFESFSQDVGRCGLSRTSHIITVCLPRLSLTIRPATLRRHLLVVAAQQLSSRDKTGPPAIIFSTF